MLLRGHVVVAGLGLGMITLNLLAKQSVRKLTLLEVDGELIDNFPALLAGGARKLWGDAIATGRLQVLQVDCKKPFSKVVKDAIGRVDYMWVDIWPTLGSYEALEDTRFLCKQLKPRVCDYWGIELDVISLMNRERVSADTSGVFQAVKDLGIPASPLSFSKLQKDVYKDLVVMAGAHVVFASGITEAKSSVSL